MADQGTANRWWENYLVRYLMPSVAGMVIVLWLGRWAGEDFRKALLLPESGTDLDAATLTLLFLYGNLFCYVSSYPILGFHITRVIDFEAKGWCRSKGDGYIATAILVLLAGLVAYLVSSKNMRVWMSLGLTAAFSLLQFWRFKSSFKPVVVGSHLKIPASLLYAYAYRLARRRGVTDEMRKEKYESRRQKVGYTPEERTRTIRWRREFVESYRHLREHGNSGFIFILELALAALCCTVLDPDGKALAQLSLIAVLFAIWAAPTIAAHLQGQYLERRFSLFDADSLRDVDIDRELVADDAALDD